jgi:hypothetical protein
MFYERLEGNGASPIWMWQCSDPLTVIEEQQLEELKELFIKAFLFNQHLPISGDGYRVLMAFFSR